jgi:drug/metabolite transporter (DMT)-like permease
MADKRNDEDVSKTLLQTSAKMAQFEVENHAADSGKKIKAPRSNLYLKLHGICFGILSAFFYAISSTLVKKAKMFTGTELATIQYILRIILLTTIARYKGLNIFGEKGKRKLLAYRGFSGALTMIFINFSTKLIVPSDSIALLHTNVIMVAVLARVFLGDKFTMVHLIILVFTCFGVLFISQPSFLKSWAGIATTGAALVPSDLCTSLGDGALDCLRNGTLNVTTLAPVAATETTGYKLYLGISFGMAAAMASAAVAVLLKKLNNVHVHYSIAIVYAAYIGLPIALALSIIMYLTGIEKVKDWSIYSTNDMVWQCIWCLISGLTGIAAQATYHVSLKHEDPTVISVMRCTDLFFTFILQFLFMNITANMFSTTGAILIFVATLFTLIFKSISYRVNNKKDAHKSDENEELSRLSPVYNCLNFGC